MSCRFTAVALGKGVRGDMERKSELSNSESLSTIFNDMANKLAAPNSAPQRYRGETYG